MENNIIIYQTQDGKTKIDVKIEQDTVWLTQNEMVELFQSRTIYNACKLVMYKSQSQKIQHIIQMLCFCILKFYTFIR